MADPTVVPRPRLLKRLAEDPDRTILICAPCGYGKSVLLDQWAEAEERPVVRAAPSDLTTGFLAEVAARRGPFVLALDDVTELRGAGSSQILETLSRTMPPGSQLALLSRVDPPLPLGRLRANRLLTEIRRTDLAMTREECGEALAGMGLEVSEPRLEEVLRKTEGWPAAVYLLGLALRGGDQARVVREFSGADPTIADYIREELLAPLPAAQRDFIRSVSPLERISGPLCDAVLDRADSEETVDRLAATSLLRALDPRGEWFGLHPLVRGLLRAELHRADPGLERAVNVRASEWWRAEGFTDLAMHHAAAAGDVRGAGALFWSAAPDYIVGGDAPTVVRWLQVLGATAVERSVELSLTKGLCRFVLGSGSDAQHWASTARDLLASDPALRQEPTLLAGLALLDAALSRRGIGPMTEAISAGGMPLPDRSPWQAARCLLLGVGAQLQGREEGARRALEEGAYRAGFKAPLLEALCRSQLALIALDRGDRPGAWAEAERARARVARRGLPDYPSAAVVYAMSACVLAEQGTSDRACLDLRSAESLFGQLDDHATWFEVETRILIARAHAGLGHRREAEEHLAAAAAQASGVPDAPVLLGWIAETREAAACLGSSGAELLTPAELRILQLLPTHLSLPQIGESLCVSPNTVKTHTRNIYAKFGVSSRRAAVARADQDGLLAQRGPAFALT